MEPYFIVMKSNIDVMNLTKHSGVQYPRGTVIRYFCKDGYESIHQNSELNITCGNYGQWTPQLIGCIGNQTIFGCFPFTISLCRSNRLLH